MPIVDRFHRNYEFNGIKNIVNYVARDNTDYPFHFTYTASTISNEYIQHASQMLNYEVGRITLVSAEKGENVNILNYVRLPDGDEVRIEVTPTHFDNIF